MGRVGITRGEISVAAFLPLEGCLREQRLGAIGRIVLFEALIGGLHEPIRGKLMETN